MEEHIYKKIEIVGTSENSLDEAIQNGVHRAAKTIQNMRWFEVTEIRGNIDNNKVGLWQVALKIGFTIED